MHAYTPFYSPFALGLTSMLAPIIAIVVLWTVILKGFALWHAARNSQKWWFIALLIINTLGILEIIYLIWFRTKSPSSPAKESTPVHTSSPV